MLPRINRQLRVLLSRKEFRQNPPMAIFRRVRWRLRWLRTSRPWKLQMRNGMVIHTSFSGAGALIYYQGVSEPETAEFILDFLKPAMTFIDVGAHIGEFTLLACSKVGNSGHVHTFEPQPDTYELLLRNLKSNKIRNVKPNCMAVAHVNGELSFEVRAEPSMSSISCPTKSSAIWSHTVKLRCSLRVPSRTLDSYCRGNYGSPELVKVDVEGAELLVLQGAIDLLRLPPDRAPVWILEYSPRNYSRFGYDTDRLCDYLYKLGYRTFALREGPNLEPFPSLGQTAPAPRNLVATKKPLK